MYTETGEGLRMLGSSYSKSCAPLSGIMDIVSEVIRLVADLISC